MPVPEGDHLLLYDGVCGMCDGLIQFVLRRDQGVFDFAALQSSAAHAALAPFGANADVLTTMYVVVNYRGAAPRLLAKSRAALFVIARLGWPWKAGALLGVLPTSVLDYLYDIVARYRYRVFGQHDHCLMPRPEVRGRFIDSLS
jgi:predicted DCC family thiol-disulfide oxidoreductase YuxK